MEEYLCSFFSNFRIRAAGITFPSVNTKCQLRNNVEFSKSRENITKSMLYKKSPRLVINRNARSKDFVIRINERSVFIDCIPT